MPSGLLRDFPTQFDGPIPLFTADGSLPPGDFGPSRLEFEVRFVNIGDVPRRALLYTGWNHHRDALIRAGVPSGSHQLLDGSYTTAKNSPGDIDIAVEVPIADSTTLENLTPDHPIVGLLQGPLMKSTYHCDSYPIYALPKQDPVYTSVTVRAIEYWTKWFGRGRSGNPKGRVWATTGGFR